VSQKKITIETCQLIPKLLFRFDGRNSPDFHFSRVYDFWWYFVNNTIIVTHFLIGKGLDQQKSQAIIKLYSSKTGMNEIDSAILYQQGKTEKLLGKLVLSLDKLELDNL
jgi:hypothetical protein